MSRRALAALPTTVHEQQPTKLSQTTKQPQTDSHGKQPVRVFVRVRPSADEEPCVWAGSDSIRIANPRNRTETLSYCFDRVFGPSNSQDNVFDQVEPIVLKTLDGINATIFAYGQTGSGKTHTINGPSESPGIIPRTIQSLLTNAKKRSLSVSISASYLEIYNEKIRDLFVDNPKLSSGLDLREAADKSILVVGLSSLAIQNMSDFEKHHEVALKNRSTAATNLNEASSRSHFVLQLNIQISLKGGRRLTSKLHIIDLAGSEDNKRTGNIGVRMVESGAINKSLFVLGQVVEALNKGLPRIPYRDSKITRLLQDSLGGSAIGLMIACCAPDQEHYWDTYNTLNFALKSSMVRNVVVCNESADPTQASPSIQNRSSAPLSRKQELLEWRQRIKPSTNGSSHPSRKLVRLSDGSTCSTESSVSSLDRSRIMSTSSLLHQRDSKNTDLSELVRVQVEEQLKHRLANIRAELSSDKPSSKQSGAASTQPSAPNSTPQEFLKRQTETDILNVINTGTIKDIMKLKQVGKKRAEAIYQARQDLCQPDDGFVFERLNDLNKAGLSQKIIDGILTANIKL